MWKAKNCICFDMANVIFNTTNARLVEIEFSFGNWQNFLLLQYLLRKLRARMDKFSNHPVHPVVIMTLGF